MLLRLITHTPRNGQLLAVGSPQPMGDADIAAVVQRLAANDPDLTNLTGRDIGDPDEAFFTALACNNTLTTLRLMTG